MTTSNPDQPRDNVDGKYTNKEQNAPEPTVELGGDRTNKWFVRLHELADFVGENERMPRASDAHEKSMALWVSNQLRDARAGATRLTPERQAALDAAVPTWKSTQEDTWKATAEAVAAFITANSRFPDRRDADPVEQRLGFWLARHRTDARSGLVTVSRLAFLDSTVPGWQRTKNDDWDSKAHQTFEFFQEHGRWPSTTAPEPEKTLGQWLSNMRRPLPTIPVDDPAHAEDVAIQNAGRQHRIAKLDEIVPGWNAGRTTPDSKDTAIQDAGRQHRIAKLNEIVPDWNFGRTAPDAEE